MAGERYVPIQFEEMRALLEDEMGGVRRDDPDCGEMIWVRPVTTKTGSEFPYEIKVYTTIDRGTGKSRSVGADAIRLVLMDTVTGRPVKAAEKRVFRTKNALVNLRGRARDLFRDVLKGPHCPRCGSLMVLRQGGPRNREFLGCTHYAPSKPWHCTGTIWPT